MTFKLSVSGVHARIQKKEGNLLVTDLDSTNGTFIDDKKLKPGVVATVSSGSSITFGTLSNLFLCLNCSLGLIVLLNSQFGLYSFKVCN